MLPLQESELSLQDLCGLPHPSPETMPSSFVSGFYRRGGVHLGKGGPRPAWQKRGGFWDTESGAARRESPVHGDISGLLSWQHSAGSET